VNSFENLDAPRILRENWSGEREILLVGEVDLVVEDPRIFALRVSEVELVCGTSSVFCLLSSYLLGYSKRLFEYLIESGHVVEV